MSNYKIVIQYDGTNYRGWQVQNSTKDTIQGKLEHILKKLTNQEVDVIGSGRTDAGVHAKGQVANFNIKLPKGMTDADLLFHINKHLPEDIAVVSLERVDDRFHARYSEKGKTYRYRIHVSPVANVFEKRFVYTFLDKPLDVEAMRQAAAQMVGRHDFKAFCGNKKMKKSTIRTVKSVDIHTVENEHGIQEIYIDYTGDGFLQNMIRIMTGTLIEVGYGRKSADSVAEIIESMDRENAGYTAPPEGLCLMEVYY